MLASDTNEPQLFIWHEEISHNTHILGQHCVWYEGIGVTVSQLIPCVLSDSRDPRGTSLLLRIHQSMWHLSCQLKHQQVRVYFTFTPLCVQAHVCSGLLYVMHFWFCILNHLAEKSNVSEMFSSYPTPTVHVFHLQPASHLPVQLPTWLAPFSRAAYVFICPIFNNKSLWLQPLMTLL